MKSKLVLWGNDAADTKVLVALQLRPEDNKVDVWMFPAATVSDEFSRAMLQEWREGAEIAFPENHTHVERDLTGSILPDDIKVDKAELVQRAQSEWHFLVLSHKLDALYRSELDTMKDRIAKLEAYDQGLWDELKGFWDKVRDQVSSRNLMREQADALRTNINDLFTQLKGMRTMVDDDFRQLSQSNFDAFSNRLGELENRIKEQINTSDIFEELKRLQTEFKEVTVSRDFRMTIWDRIDGAFKAVKEKRFGSNYNNTHSGGSALERITRRFDGLMSAIGKMEDSISRDEAELKMQQDRVASGNVGQLEMQITEAKMAMIKTRIVSKQEKLAEMNETRADLESQKARATARERYEDKAPAGADGQMAAAFSGVVMEQTVAETVAPPVAEVNAPVVEAVVEMEAPMQEPVAVVEEVVEMEAPMQEPVAVVEEVVEEVAASVVEMEAPAIARSHPDDADAAGLSF